MRVCVHIHERPQVHQHLHVHVHVRAHVSALHIYERFPISSGAHTCGLYEHAPVHAQLYTLAYMIGIRDVSLHMVDGHSPPCPQGTECEFMRWMTFNHLIKDLWKKIKG